MSFARWREYFERNRVRPMPDLGRVRAGWAPLLARSLAVFQLGESKGGRLANEIDSLPGLDADYKAAIKLFVAEEQRHGDVLAACVSALGGELMKTTWTESLFLVARRLAGVRFKLVVLLAAETVGLAFYRGIITRLPKAPLRDALSEICDDEVQHLKFHGDAFRGDLAFRYAFYAVVTAASAVVLVDHRKTHRALGIPLAESVSRFCGHVISVGTDLAADASTVVPASAMTAA
jgi:demethoxyubiquinone hydroxylase (CLK1/Coq7/Cat5 family)